MAILTEELTFLAGTEGKNVGVRSRSGRRPLWARRDIQNADSDHEEGCARGRSAVAYVR